MQGQLRRLYVPCPPLSSAFRPPFRRPFHIGFGRRTEQHAPGAVGAIERVEFARFPARRHFGGLRPSDCGELIDTLHPFTEAVRVHDRGHRIELPPARIAAQPFFRHSRRKMRALAIEIVMRRKAGLGPAAAQAGARRQRLLARPVVPGEAGPGSRREIGPRRRGRRIAPPTDVFGIVWIFHGGALGGLEEEGGGDVPALAFKPAYAGRCWF